MLFAVVLHVISIAMTPGAQHHAVPALAADTTIFRYADLGLGRIVLGDPLSALTTLGVRESDDVYRFPIGFPGTAWIRVHLTSDARVAGMVFSYNAAFDFQEAVADYTTDLGPHTEHMQTATGDRYAWEDGQTQFELVRTADERYSILRDARLTPVTSISPPVTLSAADMTVKDLLAATELSGFMVSYGPQVIDAVRVVRPALSEEVAEKLLDHLAPLNLYGLVTKHLSTRYSQSELVTLSEQLFAESRLRRRALVDTFEPPVDLETYAATLEENLPSRERIQLVLEFVAANQVGAFYLALDDATAEARDAILDVLPGEVDRPQPLTAQEQAGLIENYTMAGLIGFLWQFQPLDNAEITAELAFFETPAGEQFVKRYTAALASALIEAGNSAAESLASAAE